MVATERSHVRRSRKKDDMGTCHQSQSPLVRVTAGQQLQKLLACIVSSNPACVTFGFSTRHARFDSDTVADLPLRYALANRNDLASRFMSSSTRIGHNHGSNRTMAPEMHIGPIDLPQYIKFRGASAEADPQIPVALICKTTSPLPGFGTGFLMSLTSWAGLYAHARLIYAGRVRRLREVLIICV